MAIQVLTREEHQAIHSNMGASSSFTWHKIASELRYVCKEVATVQVKKISHYGITYYTAYRVVNHKVDIHKFRTLKEAKAYCERRFLVYSIPKADSDLSNMQYVSSYEDIEEALQVIDTFTNPDVYYYGLGARDILIGLNNTNEGKKKEPLKWVLQAQGS